MPLLFHPIFKAQKPASNSRLIVYQFPNFSSRNVPKTITDCGIHAKHVSYGIGCNGCSVALSQM
jgi:hypothetical protein